MDNIYLPRSALNADRGRSILSMYIMSRQRILSEQEPEYILHRTCAVCSVPCRMRLSNVISLC